MLKRNGEACKYTVPDFVGRLTSSEFDSYNEAFDAIKDEFAALQKIKVGVKELTANPGIFVNPDSHVSGESIETQFGERSELKVHWDVRSRLLKLDHCDVLLCERTADGEKEYAVIERYQKESPYARAHGNASVLLVSNDPLVAVQDYAANAEHTLRFMASNMVATAQTIVWERFANQNPSRVVRAISERCAKAVGEVQNEIQARILEPRLSHRQSKERQQSMGQGV
jgi:hypothetical protein